MSVSWRLYIYIFVDIRDPDYNEIFVYLCNINSHCVCQLLVTTYGYGLSNQRPHVAKRIFYWYINKLRNKSHTCFKLLNLLADILMQL